MQNKYTIINKIASGGMAEVFLARSTAAMGLGKFVAIKKILPHFSEHPQYLEMFKAEAQIAMQMQHRNLVSIHDFGIEEGQCFLVMELVMGLTLRQVLNSIYKSQKIISVPMALHLVAEAAAGLHNAHEITIHRDVSPANIMISFNGDVKVIDFGVAKPKDKSEEALETCLKGKLGYMSPEQLMCQPLDPRSDIFSLGVVLYEMLSQRKPFRGKTETELISEIQSQDIQWIQELNPSVDSDLAILVHKALRIDPRDRFGTMDELGRELREYLNMKYPQFTLSDIAQFMKREFSSEHQDYQEKLFGFTPKPSRSDDTALTNTARIETSENPPVLIKVDIATPIGMTFETTKSIQLEALPVKIYPTPAMRGGSRIVRKKFQIKYAHQANSELSAIFEMESMSGAKRGTLC